MPSTPSLSGSTLNAQLANAKQERVLTAMLRCHLCSETCGALESSGSLGLGPIAHFTSADGSLKGVVAWQRLCCPRCGSRSLFVDELEIVTRRHESPIDMALEIPRRGRPPRWLVELRAREAV